MALTLRTEYWNDLKARNAFKEFVYNIHGLDFTEWESAGYWDDAYTPFSYFNGDTVVASVCMYVLDAVVHGTTTRLVQISGVGTHPDWRRKGLNRQLTDIGLDWTQGQQKGVFLFSDEDAIPFYKKCGFRPMDEFLEVAETPSIAHCAGAVKLDPGNKSDRDKIYEYACQRTPISQIFSVHNAKLLMFHALYVLPNSIYEIPDLGCLVFYKRAQDRLRVFDIVGETIPPFTELYPYIADENDTTAEFHFHTDKLGLSAVNAQPLHGNNLFVRAGFPVEKPVFPFTSRA